MGNRTRIQIWLSFLFPIIFGLVGFGYFFFVTDRAYTVFRLAGNFATLGWMYYSPGKRVEAASSWLWYFVPSVLNLFNFSDQTHVAILGLFFFFLVVLFSIYLPKVLFKGKSPHFNYIFLWLFLLHPLFIPYFSSGIETPLLIVAPLAFSWICLADQISNRTKFLLLSLFIFVSPCLLFLSLLGGGYLVHNNKEKLKCALIFSFPLIIFLLVRIGYFGSFFSSDEKILIQELLSLGVKSASFGLHQFSKYLCTGILWLFSLGIFLHILVFNRLDRFHRTLCVAIVIYLLMASVGGDFLWGKSLIVPLGLVFIFTLTPLVTYFSERKNGEILNYFGISPLPVLVLLFLIISWSVRPTSFRDISIFNPWGLLAEWNVHTNTTVIDRLPPNDYWNQIAERIPLKRRLLLVTFPRRLERFSPNVNFISLFGETDPILTQTKRNGEQPFHRGNATEFLTYLFWRKVDWIDARLFRGSPYESWVLKYKFPVVLDTPSGTWQREVVFLTLRDDLAAHLNNIISTPVSKIKHLILEQTAALLDNSRPTPQQKDEIFYLLNTFKSYLNAEQIKKLEEKITKPSLASFAQSWLMNEANFELLTQQSNANTDTYERMSKFAGASLISFEPNISNSWLGDHLEHEITDLFQIASESTHQMRREERFFQFFPHQQHFGKFFALIEYSKSIIP